MIQFSIISLFAQVSCGDGDIGFGKKKRSIPFEMPNDPNRIYEVEMTTILRIESKNEPNLIKTGKRLIFNLINETF